MKVRTNYKKSKGSNPTVEDPQIEAVFPHWTATATRRRN